MHRLLVVCTLVVILSTSTGHAQWEHVAGPDGGPVTRLALNPTNGYVFALANGMPYRSTNEGASWTPMITGINGRFKANAIASSGSDTYMSGIYGANFPFYRSTNYGATWTVTTSTDMPQFFSPDAITISGNTVVASSNLNAGIYFSTNHGENWQVATGLPANVRIGSFASRGGYLYAGSSLGSSVKGIYRSGDNGASWTATNATFLTGALAFLTCLTANANAIFAGTGLTGTYRCTDTGSLWTKINPDATSDFNSAIVATSTNVYICLNAGRVDRADQNGDGWTHVNNGLPASAANESIPAITASGSSVIAGTAKLGIYRSTNLGGLWSESNTGLHASKINGMLVAGSNLYAASATNGFYRSGDHGNSWVPIKTGIVQNGDWFAFTSVSTGLLGGAGLAHLYKSANSGDLWTVSNTTLGLNTVACFARGGADSVYAAGNAGISLSTNAGANWTFNIAGTSLGEIVLDILKDGPFMMIGGDVGGCARSIDNGQTWTAPILGLQVNGSNPAFAKVDTVWFVANTAHGVYRSYDRGHHWAKSTTGIAGAPWCMLTLGSDLYVGTAGGVWVSSNHGTSWTSFSAGLPDSITVNKLAADAQYLYAGTTNLSVWRLSRASSCCVGITGNVDCDVSQGIDIEDLSKLIDHLFISLAPLCCNEEANIDGQASVDISDLSRLIDYLYISFTPPETCQ